MVEWQSLLAQKQRIKSVSIYIYTVPTFIVTTIEIIVFVNKASKNLYNNDY